MAGASLLLMLFLFSIVGGGLIALLAIALQKRRKFLDLLSFARMPRPTGGDASLFSFPECLGARRGL